jgi:hypothetical protein
MHETQLEPAFNLIYAMSHCENVDDDIVSLILWTRAPMRPWSLDSDDPAERFEVQI